MATDQRRVAALVDAQARAGAAVLSQLRRLIGQRLGRMSDADFYVPGVIEPVADELAARSLTAQRARADIAGSYTRRLLDEMGAPVKAPPPTDVTDLRNGADPVEVWLRPMKEYRYQMSQGKTPAEARAAALRRAELIADTNLQLADRKAAQDVMEESDKTIGWRRVIHPELSQGGTCGLCVAASTRFYYVEELRAVHERCKCTTVPILSGSDIGDDLNTYDLRKLYEDAGSTSGPDLKRSRYQIDEHGELGPVLRRKGDNFRDAQDVEHDLGRPKTVEPIDLDAALTRDEAVAQLQTLLRQAPHDKAAIRAKKAEISRLNRRGA